MITFNLETKKLSTRRRLLVSTERTDDPWPQPWISGIYLLLDSWDYPISPNKLSVYMATDPSGRLLDIPEKPVLRFGEDGIHADWFDLDTKSDWSGHRKYISQQESLRGGPALDGVWFRMDAFLNQKPPTTMSVRLWAKG